LDDVRYDLPLNDGVNSLHGGFEGFDKRVWDAEIIDDVSLRLSLVIPDGEEEYPGTLDASIVFTVVGDRLEVDYFASTDKPTVVNLTNHVYFNLGDSETILEHDLWMDADLYTPVNNGLIPTGVLEPVEGTPFDFRDSTRIGSRIDDDHPQLVLGNGYDHNYVLNQVMNPQITVTEPTSGRVLEVSTTMPGVQFYTGNFLDGKEMGRNGPIGFRGGLCLETQFYPDSPNKPDFPSPVLRPGGKYIEKTVYRFTVVS
jgi:aldose 1-epimerase